ncbi:MAG TPA: hypothetical protein PK253_14935, partial [Spirochaetota bacterium]|nr:hypothetical protein [Spirochaetota bacterium]
MKGTYAKLITLAAAVSLVFLPGIALTQDSDETAVTNQTRTQQQNRYQHRIRTEQQKKDAKGTAVQKRQRSETQNRNTYRKAAP